ncbi:MAG: 3,4-dioxygenase subunit beta [Thermoleophilia bacterium]
MTTQRTRQVVEEDGHAHDAGLSLDLPTMLTRRRALGLAALGGLTTILAACGSGDGDAAGATTATSTTATSDASVAEVPEETAGPYPADGSNGVNVLTRSGIVRSDITRSFGTGSAVAEGVPLTIAMTVLDVQAGGTPVAGAAVYAWHCDREGRYSLYDSSLTNEDYLRGVQETDASGTVTFRSIFPAAYSGRWPHIHFEVYPSLAEATAAGSKLVTSQIAMPEDACDAVYATSGYEQSVTNLAQTSLATDMVFADGYSTQLGTVTGSTGSGMTVSLNVGV